jgi:glycosyltransferase involved in cell wall biosynthesis
MSDEEKLNRLGEMGKARAEKLFNWDLVSEKVLALYRSQD